MAMNAGPFLIKESLCKRFRDPKAILHYINRQVP